MSKTSTRWLTGAALLAGLALATPASGQRDPGAPAPTPPHNGGAPERTGAAAPAAPAAQGAAREPGATPAAGHAPAGRGTASREEMLAALAAGETAHRERVAKLQRLRELAEAKGQKDRLAQIAALEGKETENFNALRGKARGVLGDETFKHTDEQLAKGRRHAQQAHDANAARKPSQDAGKDAKQEHAQAQREKQADKPAHPGQAAPQGERPKPAPDAQPGRAGNGASPQGEHPKAAPGAGHDRGGNDAAPQAERPPRAGGDATPAGGHSKPADGRGDKPRSRS